MTNFSFPTSDLDDSRKLISSLGSFWATTYVAKDQIKSFVQAMSLSATQAHNNSVEMADARSRHDIPIFHTENWYPIVIKKSETNLAPINFLKFNETGLRFDGVDQILFNQTASRNVFAFPVPKALAAVCQIFDQISLPKIGLSQNIDFAIVDSSIAFIRDPFAQDLFKKTPVFVDGLIADETITLWAFKAQFDYDWLFRQFGYSVDLRVKTSNNSKKFINTILTGLVDGAATATTLTKALSAIFDIPVALSSGEIVEVVARDNAGIVIVTDKHVYRFSATSVPTVVVGDILTKNATMIAGFLTIELNHGRVPETLTGLAIDHGFTAACFYGDLVFENRAVPLEVITNHPSAYTYIKFPLVGLPQDIQHFFDELHARGLENLPDLNAPICEDSPRKQGTLAHILSGRNIALGEPDAADLPDTINPLVFIAENVLRNNVVIVTINISALGPNHLGLHNIRHIRQLLPPYMALIVAYTLDAQIDAITPEDSIRESLLPFKAAEPIIDILDDSVVIDRGAVVRSISGTCQ